MSISAHFGCLDELTQVIYQSVYRFVIVSNVTGDEWSVHIGLADSNGRWWRGRWTEDDVRRTLGSKASDMVVETFAEKLKEAFVQGQLFVGNFGVEKGKDINLTFDPGSKNAMQLSLYEIDPSEAATFAINVLLEIALQAQTRGCNLHPSAYAAPARPVLANVDTRFSELGKLLMADHIIDPITQGPTPVVRSTNVAAEASHRDSDQTAKESRTTEAGVKVKGASLANPNKRARKYQAVEFESEEE